MGRPWYRYRRRDFVKGKPTSTEGVSFDEFLLEYCKEDRKPFANVGSQAKFLEPRPNGTKVNHLFRYDHQEALIDFLQERLERKIDLGQHNVSPKMELKPSADVVAYLQKAKAEEFELYKSIP